MYIPFNSSCTSFFIPCCLAAYFFLYLACSFFNIRKSITDISSIFPIYLPMSTSTSSSSVFLIFLAFLLLSRLSFSQQKIPLHGQHLSVKAFSANEFRSIYELMVQYKFADSPTCPGLISYDAYPQQSGQTLTLQHKHMLIGPDNTTLHRCVDNQQMTLLRADNLLATRLTQFLASIQPHHHKLITFQSLFSQLQPSAFYISIRDSARTCGEKTWFQNQETSFFFHEPNVTNVSIVPRLVLGQPKVTTISLIGNIRYMIIVNSGSTCIYRVQVDVNKVKKDLAHQSSTPSATISVCFLSHLPLFPLL